MRMSSKRPSGTWVYGKSSKGRRLKQPDCRRITNTAQTIPCPGYPHPITGSMSTRSIFPRRRLSKPEAGYFPCLISEDRNQVQWAARTHATFSSSPRTERSTFDPHVATTPSCGRIFLDPQGHFTYSSISKKRLLITSPTHQSRKSDIFSHHPPEAL
jgi:hypothetical protein